MVIPCNYPDDGCDQQCSSASAMIPETQVSSCDVRFVVGPDHNTWTILGHRNMLVGRCETLATLLATYSNDQVIRIPDVDNKGFEYFLRLLEDSETNFTSVQTARSTLDVACKFHCTSVLESCVWYIDIHLSSDNVLSVLKNLAQHCSSSSHIASYAPSAPLPDNMSQPSHAQNECISNLIHNCLVFIDTHADEILQKDEFDDLSYKDMQIIVTRDTLLVSNELILFNCLVRWAKYECMRRNWSANTSNKRQILNDVIFTVRYGFMTLDEFTNGPVASGLFTAEEIDTIESILRHPKMKIRKEPMKHICQKRIKEMIHPKPLSARTIAWSKVYNAKEDKYSRRGIKTVASKVMLNCLTAWTTIFD